MRGVLRRQQHELLRQLDSGSFTTPKLGKIVVAGKGTVAGKKATLTINDESVEKAAGTIVLTAKKGKKTVTVASGKFSVPAGATGTASLKLTSAGSSLLKKSKKLVDQDHADLDHRPAEPEQDGHAQLVERKSQAL